MMTDITAALSLTALSITALSLKTFSMRKLRIIRLKIKLSIFTMTNLSISIKT